MISSRCATDITYKGATVQLSKVRLDLQKEVQSIKLWPTGKQLFECWINEDTTSATMDQTWWDHCLLQARQADIVIVLYNGESGGAIKGGPMGICHSELEAAMLRQSAKVRAIELQAAKQPTDPAQRKRDESFRKYYSSLDIFRAALAKTGEEVIERVRNELQQALVDMVQICALTPDLAKSNTGIALRWHHMNYTERIRAMSEEVIATLLDLGTTTQPDPNRSDVMSVRFDGKQLVVQLHAIPASFSEPNARSIVGQPFLFDHALKDLLATCHGGPVHLVAGYKSVTENQALKLLGFPDASVVPGTFGLHVVDPVQKIQLVLLKNCVSPTATRHAVTAWLEWLHRSGEVKLLVDRAAARKRIIAAIAKEN